MSRELAVRLAGHRLGLDETAPDCDVLEALDKYFRARIGTPPTPEQIAIVNMIAGVDVELREAYEKAIYAAKMRKKAGPAMDGLW